MEGPGVAGSRCWALADLQHGEGSQALEADWTSLLRVTLDYFYGIEIDEWPARIAETAMYMVDRQCDLRMQERFGMAPDRLPIRRQARIVVGSALKLDWREVLPPTEKVIIAGNPPFLGIALRNRTDRGAAGGVGRELPRHPSTTSQAGTPVRSATSVMSTSNCQDLWISGSSGCLLGQ
jgi:hypothetical protein